MVAAVMPMTTSQTQGVDMSLLSEQDRNQLEDALEQQIGKHAFDAIEAAILSRLVAKELPEPQKYPADCFMREVNVCDAMAVSIAIQQAHAQGFAAGAAAQLAEKPTCWVTPDGEGFRMRLSPPVNAVPLGWQELYTRREA